MKAFLQFLLFGLVVGCQPQASQVKINELNGKVFASTYSIKYVGDLDPQIWQAELDGFFEQFNDEFSTYQKDSLISKFNQIPAHVKIPVSDRFIEMLKLAQNLNQATLGAFEPTIGPVINAWGFSSDKTPEVPDNKVLKEALLHVGFKHLAWDKEKKLAWKTKNKITLNLNAFAPGWAADLIGKELEKKQIQNYMVDIGGEILVKGRKGEASWIIGIEEPSQELIHKLNMAVKITDLSISTSGDYRQFFNDKGKRRSHIIDPRSGLPVSHYISSVTTLAPTAVEADAWGTALMVLGEEGLPLAEKNGIRVLMLKAETNGSFTPILSKNMDEYLKVNKLQ